MTKVAAMPIYGKNLKKSSSPEPIGRWPWNLVCSIRYLSTTKNIQMMTLGWPWLFLRQGQIWENANALDFMESIEDFGIKMVNRVVLISKWRFVGEKVKVIVWPLTQELP